MKRPLWILASALIVSVGFTAQLARADTLTLDEMSSTVLNATFDGNPLVALNTSPGSWAVTLPIGFEIVSSPVLQWSEPGGTGLVNMIEGLEGTGGIDVFSDSRAFLNVGVPAPVANGVDILGSKSGFELIANVTTNSITWLDVTFTDHVDIGAAPEPATLSLLAVGLAGLGYCVRRGRL